MNSYAVGKKINDDAFQHKEKQRLSNKTEKPVDCQNVASR